jgi:hypothetical protein
MTMALLFCSRVTLWDKRSGKKLSGFTAPKGKNLVAYLAAHPHLTPRQPTGDVGDVGTQ